MLRNSYLCKVNNIPKDEKETVKARCDLLRNSYLCKVNNITDEILLNLSPKKLFEVITQVLTTLELSDFFGLTTFLTEINLLHQTRKVEN